MRHRQKSLQRLFAVKSQLHRLEEAKLEDILRKKQVMDEESHALFGLIGDEQKNDPLLLGLACRRLKSTDAQRRELERAEQAQKAVLLMRGAQKKALEKILKDNAQAVARDDEKRLLMDIGESLAARRPSSLP
jgi:hypothetical protein